MYALSLTITFTPEQWREFHTPISGDGGGQQFVRRMQGKARLQQETDVAIRKARDPRGRLGEPSFTLTIEGDDVETWFRYRDDYGSGGFQTRLGRDAEQQALFG